MNRRGFLKLGGLAFFTTSSGGLWASAQPLRAPQSVSLQPRGGKDVLVVVFLRGGLDGMHALVPYSEPAYYEARPNLAVPKPRGAGSLVLDERFALNPALRALMPHFEAGHLAPICAIGTSDRSRSHFIAQDYLEYGGEEAQAGWLNRSLTPKGLGLSTRAQLPALFHGPRPVINLTSLDDLRDWSEPPTAYEGPSTVAKISRQEVELRKRLRGVALPSERGEYPDTSLGEQLRTVATLLKQGVELESVHCELGGFDSHSRQVDGMWPGRLLGLNRLLYELANALDVFWRDLSELAERVTILTVTEFGRRLAENGSLGTDHGLASASFLMGGRVQGGRVFGRWPGLKQSALVDGIDLAVTTDYRDVLNEYTRATQRADLFSDRASPDLALFK